MELTSTQILPPLLGGVLIGIASALLMLLNGRVAGISGIFAGALTEPRGEREWRVAFALGLVAGGFVLLVALPSAFTATPASLPLVVVAGLLVGFGTRLGSGCTSGHGVCGLSRFSPRSLVATLTFIGAGMASVAVVRAIVGS